MDAAGMAADTLKLEIRGRPMIDKAVAIGSTTTQHGGKDEHTARVDDSVELNQYGKVLNG